MDFLHKLPTYVVPAYAIAIAVLPSIVVALTPYPKEDGWAKSLLNFLNLFSFLTHSDSPGTVKAPLSMSKPPPVVGNPVAAVKS